MFWIRIGVEKQVVRCQGNVDFAERVLYALTEYKKRLSEEVESCPKQSKNWKMR
jgi:hypothetical protein